MTSEERQRISAGLGDFSDQLCNHLAAIVSKELEDIGFVLDQAAQHRLYERLSEVLSMEITVRGH